MEVDMMAVYTTFHSSNHAGIIDTSSAEHGLFPTTSRISRKHHPLSNNHACISDHVLPFTWNDNSPIPIFTVITVSRGSHENRMPSITDPFSCFTGN
jgi:hypothetical protein